MNFLSRLYSWYGKRVVLGVGGVIILLAAVGIILAVTHTPTPIVETDEGRAVSVARVYDLSNTATLELVGTVEAIDEVRLQSEASGRITSVRTTLGAQVSAGQTIATIENASEYASLLQAEGAYEAAVAGAASSNISVESAETTYNAALQSGVNAYRDAFVAADGTIRNTVDYVFSDPRTSSPGLRIDGNGKAPALTKTRTEIEDMLRTWSRELDTVDTDNVSERLDEAARNLNEVRILVENLTFLVTQVDANSYNLSIPLTTLNTSFQSARSTIGQAIKNLENTQTSIKNSREALDRARISGTGGTVSTADASVKQALGSLRAAQANYQKTIIQTPIAGTVNSISVKTGDYVGSLSPIAVVANNTALEITTYINESERSRIAIGDEVIIENDARGTITAIAPVVDFNTKKIEVRIQTDSLNLSNGETVRISIQSLEEPTELQSDQDIIIPITALKVETDRIIVFTITDDSILEAHQVTEGPLLGTNIIIESGITPDMEIVLDARGLNEGDRVTILTQ